MTSLFHSRLSLRERTSFCGAKGDYAVILLLTVLSLAVSAAQAEPPPNAQRHALLIGVSHYPNLPAKYALPGAQADVALLSRVLREQLSFPPAQIAELSEAGGKGDAERLPTRANVERAVGELTKVCRSGDQVLLYLAGHGVQQPAPAGTERTELDGLDEVFLPRDAAGWDDDRGTIPGGILDDQIEAWVAGLQAKGARVWLVVDSCHSGTMLRGPGETVRQVPADALGIPRARLEAARRQMRGGAVREPTSFALAASPGVVAFYACRPQEVTIEQLLPRSAADAQPHGLFTYTLCEMLGQANPARPLTYRELFARLRQRYAELGRDAPSPLAEGAGLDAALFEETRARGRSAIRVLDGERINAGALQGLTFDSILALYADETSPRPLGHVRIVESRMFDADIVPAGYGDLPEPKTLRPGTICRPVYLDRGDQLLVVAIDPRDETGELLREEKRSRLRKCLEEAAGEDRSLLTTVERLEDADWLLRSTGEGVVLVPASRWQAEAPQTAGSAFGPLPLGPNLPSQLREQLGRIARASNLAKITAGNSAAVLGGENVLQLESRLLRIAGNEEQSLPWQSQPIEVASGDRLKLEIKNTNSVPLDVTVLFVDSQYGITAIFPDGEDNRLPPGRTLPVEGLTVNAATTGVEHLIVLAIHGEVEERIDLTILEQPSLTLAQAAKGQRGASALRSPLGELLTTSLYGRGRTRGLSRQSLQSYAMQAIAWTTLGKGRKMGTER